MRRLHHVEWLGARRGAAALYPGFMTETVAPDEQFTHSNTELCPSGGDSSTLALHEPLTAAPSLGHATRNLKSAQAIYNLLFQFESSIKERGAHMEAAMRSARRFCAASSTDASGLRLPARPRSKRAAIVGVTDRGTRPPPFFVGVRCWGDAPNLAAAAAGPDTCRPHFSVNPLISGLLDGSKSHSVLSQTPTTLPYAGFTALCAACTFRPRMIFPHMIICNIQKGLLCILPIVTVYNTCCCSWAMTCKASAVCGHRSKASSGSICS